ncbi:hypothetical protein BLNAU_19427 [Blattamonas nauphoetae]|uniref:Leucine Rich repeat-containing domain protein n=1 Tax=Blattamonas nauphoetae TaxID=2049346 RepID=A0ABQ9X1S3_9EUKA|nr:hypothetical protein BLNAU_19427 [Blattamonas nauphoetae]
MSPEIMSKLCHSFRTSFSAKQFTISKIPLTSEIVCEMFPLFANDSKIQTLRLIDCQIDDSVAVSLFALILGTAPPNLRCIDLSGNHIGQLPPNSPAVQYDATPSCKMLSRLIIDENIQLSSLVLSDNPLGNYGLLALSQVLPRSTLRELRIGHVGATPNGLTTLLRAMHYCPQLILLDISDNVAGYTVHHELINTLPHTRLVNLNLANTQLDDASLVHLGDALLDNESLIELDISHNKLSRQAASVFCDQMRLSQNVKHITCTNTTIPSQSVFVSYAAEALTDKPGCPAKRVEPLRNSAVGPFSPLLNKALGGVNVTGLIYLLVLAFAPIVALVMNGISLWEYFNIGETALAIALAVLVGVSLILCSVTYIVLAIRRKKYARIPVGVLHLFRLGALCDAFTLFSRTKGNWDEMADPNDEKEMWHEDTFTINSIISTVAYSFFAVIIQGYVLMGRGLSTSVSIIPILSFIGSLISVSWSLSSFYVTVRKDLTCPVDIDSSIFWQIRIFISQLVSYCHVLFRYVFFAAHHITTLVVFICLSFCVWLLFYMLACPLILVSASTHVSTKLTGLIKRNNKKSVSPILSQNPSKGSSPSLKGERSLVTNLDPAAKTTMTTQTTVRARDYMFHLLRATILAVLSIITPSDLLFSSPLGITLFSKWVRQWPRIVFVCADVVMVVVKGVVTLFFALSHFERFFNEQGLSETLTIVSLIVVFMDAGLVLLRIGTEQNGVSTRRKAENEVKALKEATARRHHKQLEKEKMRRKKMFGQEPQPATATQPRVETTIPVVERSAPPSPQGLRLNIGDARVA